MSRSEKTVFFTIGARNYLSQIATLASSLEKNIENLHFYVFIADAVQNEVESSCNQITTYHQLKTKHTILGLDSFDLDLISDMFGRYNPTEFCTAIKPMAFLKILEREGPCKVIYMDPDTYVYGKMQDLMATLDSHGVAITPHITKGFGDHYLPDLKTIQLAGVYNFGFFAVNFHFSGVESLMRWWDQTLRVSCYVDLENGIFVDQKWGNLFPCFYDQTSVFHHPSYNVAYWNMHERSFVRHKDQILVNGKPLEFFHFSGFSPLKPSSISKYQNRFLLPYIPVVRDLFREYSSKMLANDFVAFSNIPFGANFHESGVIDQKNQSSFHVKLDNSGPFNSRFAAIESLYLTVIKLCVRLIFFLVTFKFITDFKNTARCVFIYLRGILSTVFFLVDRSLPKSGRILLRRWKNAAQEMWIKTKKKKVVLSSPVVESEPLSDSRRINVFGYLDSEHGVGEAGRGLSRAIIHYGNKHSKNVALYVYDKTPARRNELSLGSHFTKDRILGDVSLVHVNADQVQEFYRSSLAELAFAKKSIGYWYWEMEEFPDKWIAAQNYFDEIWVATEFVKKSLEKKIHKPIYVIPPSYEIQSYHYDRSKFKLPEDAHVFLVIFDGFSLMARKNPMSVIQAFSELLKTPNCQKCCLAIKTINLSESEKIRLDKLTEGMPVVFIHDYLTRQEVRDLVGSCDTYVSMHRSEGLGLNLIEAMSFEKSVLATNYSGNVDFMNQRNSYPINYTLSKIKKSVGPYEEGMVWAEPSVEHTVELMKDILLNPETAKLKGKQARKDIQEYFSEARISGFVKDRLESQDSSVFKNIFRGLEENAL